MNIRKTLLAAVLSATTFTGALPALAHDEPPRRDDTPRYNDRVPQRDDDHRHDDEHRHDDRERRGETLELLGVISAGRETDRDVLEVRRPERYKALVFRVERGDAIVDDIKVTFKNETTYSPETKRFFHEGERSYRMDFPGITRDIHRVRFLFRSAGRGQTVIQVFGVK